jgi:hypothetical protein
MKQLDTNLDALGQDPRYARHTGDELLKAAYYRGFAEQKAQFEDKPFNAKTYDSKMADRALIAKLPDVPELDGIQVPEAQRQHHHTHDQDEHLP